MIFEKVVTKGCCGKISIAYKLQQPFAITTNFGTYNLNKRYLKSGIFYFEDDKIIGIVPHGSNFLQIKAKTHNIEGAMNNLELFLKNL